VIIRAFVPTLCAAICTASRLSCAAPRAYPLQQTPPSLWIPQSLGSAETNKPNAFNTLCDPRPVGGVFIMTLQECPQMRKVHAAGVVLALSFVIGACGSDENDDQLTDAQGAAIAAAIGDQIATIPTAFTATGVAGTAGGGGLFFSRPALRVQGITLAPFRSGAACPNVSGDLSDPDQDDVPTDATLTFVSPDCDGTNDDGFDYTVTGTLNIEDLLTTAVGYTATFSNIITTVTTNTGTIALEFDGTHGVSGTSGGGTLGEDLTLHVTAQGAGGTVTGTVRNDWSISFTAPNNDLEMGLPLPDGTFDVDGTFTYDVNGVRAQFNITTQTPLDFDPNCALEHKFSAGELRAHLEGESANVYAKIVYTGCGDTPDVTFFGRNS